MRPTRREVLAGALIAPMAARAQSWPSGPVKVIVPFPPGGSVDAIARLVQPGLQARLGPPLIIENQGGGSGSIGAARVARSASDGNTWLFVFDSHAVNPFLQSLPFDTGRDLDPVLLIGTAPNVLATHPSRPFRTIGDVIEAAKAKPDTVSYATIGAGSIGHLTMVRVAKQTGTRLVHVPYRGGGPAMNDAIAGHVDLIIGSAALVTPQVKTGSLRPLAQFAASRTPLLQAVPTAAEGGVAGVESNAWWGVFAPAGTPRAAVDRFGADLAATLRDERVAKTLAESQQVEVTAWGPERFRAFFDNEMRVWGQVVKENDVKADL